MPLPISKAYPKTSVARPTSGARSAHRRGPRVGRIPRRLYYGRVTTIEPLRALRDNYIWTLAGAGRALVVDPGEAAPVEAWLARTGNRLTAILLTHHHPDHVGGVAALVAHHGCPVYGPAAERIAAVDRPVRDGETVAPGPEFPSFQVLVVPGHTAGHVAYYGDGLLFCGDTLFSGGCGRLFEGTADELRNSLRRLASLPAETRVFAGHEYTANNLRFALAVAPDDAELEKALAKATEIMENGSPTLPSTLGWERRFNVFLRTGEPAIRQAAERAAGRRLGNETEVFAALRRWKDRF